MSDIFRSEKITSFDKLTISYIILIMIFGEMAFFYPENIEKMGRLAVIPGIIILPLPIFIILIAIRYYFFMSMKFPFVSEDRSYSIVLIATFWVPVLLLLVIIRFVLLAIM